MITFGAAGAAAYSAASGTTVAPAYPTGITAGQMLVLILGQKPSTANGGTATTPTGWTLVGSHLAQGGYGSTLGADTGNTNLFIYTKVADGTETGSLTVTVGTNNVSWAYIARYTTTSTGWAAAVLATGAISATPTNPVTVTSTSLAMQAGDLLVYAFCFATDTLPTWVDVPTMSSASAHIPATTQIVAPGTTNGNDIGGNSGYATALGNGAATGTVTWSRFTNSTLTNIRGPFVVVRLRENPVLIPAANNVVTAAEIAAAIPVPLTPAVQQVTAAEIAAAFPVPLTPAVQQVTALEMTVAWRVADIPAGLAVSVWNGTAEIAASVTVWDGATEIAAVVEQVV